MIVVWNDTNGARGAGVTRSEARSAGWSYQQGRPWRHMPRHLHSGYPAMGGRYRAVTRTGDDCRSRRWRAIAIARDAAVVRRGLAGGDWGGVRWLRIRTLVVAIGDGACYGFNDSRRLRVADGSVRSGMRGCRHDARTVGHQTDGEQYSQQDGPDRHARKLTAQAGALGKPRLTEGLAGRTVLRATAAFGDPSGATAASWCQAKALIAGVRHPGLLAG